MITADALLDNYDAGVKELATHVRSFILERLPGCLEIPDPAAGLIGYAYGRGYSNVICTLLLSKKGVKLGIWKGAQLPDPHQLLAGKGKLHRYVEIKTRADFAHPGLAELLAAALQRYNAGK